MSDFTLEIIPESIQMIKMSDEEYFSSKYKEYISNSKLSLLNPLEGGSYDLFSNGFPNKYSESYEFGSVIHSILLQPESYNISDINKPSGKLGLFAEEFYKLRKTKVKIADAIKQASINSDYYSNSFTKKRIQTAISSSLDFYLKRIKDTSTNSIYLSKAIKDKAVQCLDCIKNSDIPKFLNPDSIFGEVESFNEYAIFCEILVKYTSGLEVILKIKGKIDNFTINRETSTITLNDLKTTGKPVNYFMGNFINNQTEWIDGSFQKYHYYRQMGMYLFLLQAAIKQLKNIHNYTLKSNMLVIESFPNFNSRIFVVNGNYIKAGLDEFKELINLVVNERKIRNLL